MLEQTRNVDQPIPEPRCPCHTNDRQDPTRSGQHGQPCQGRPKVGEVVQHSHRNHHVETAGEVMGQDVSKHPLDVPTRPTCLLQNPLISVDAHDLGHDTLQLPGQQSIAAAHVEGRPGAFRHLLKDHAVVMDVVIPARWARPPLISEKHDQPYPGTAFQACVAVALCTSLSRRARCLGISFHPPSHWVTPRLFYHGW